MSFCGTSLCAPAHVDIDNISCNMTCRFVCNLNLVEQIGNMTTTPAHHAESGAFLMLCASVVRRTCAVSTGVRITKGAQRDATTQGSGAGPGIPGSPSALAKTIFFSGIEGAWGPKALLNCPGSRASPQGTRPLSKYKMLPFWG